MHPRSCFMMNSWNFYNVCHGYQQLHLSLTFIDSSMNVSYLLFFYSTSLILPFIVIVVIAINNPMIDYTLTQVKSFDTCVLMVSVAIM
jgi:hypothetical protein